MKGEKNSFFHNESFCIMMPIRQVKAASQKAGDLGEVAQHSTKAQGTLSFGQTIKTLSARQVLVDPPKRNGALANIRVLCVIAS